MKIGELKPKEGSRKRKKRIGRGTSSGHGKTCGRGHKGQKARKGVKGPGFEGGQTPLMRRLPKLPSFKNYPFKKEYVELNLRDLERFGDEISKEKLIKEGIIKEGDKVKILGIGEIKRPIRVEVDAISKGAKEKIISAHGEVKLIQ